MSEMSVSSSAPINVVMEKAKANKRKVVRKKDLPPPVLFPFGGESDSGSNESVAKKTKTVELAPSTTELAFADTSSALVGVVRPYATETAERPT